MFFKSTAVNLLRKLDKLQNEVMNLPLVKNYLDCHQYLEEVYHYNKSINPDFSYQSWSEDLQVKSKSFLRQAILGKKNISSELTEKLATWLNLSPGDRQHFTLLVEHTQCTVPEIKKILSQQLLSQIRQDQQVPAKVSQLSKSDPLFLQIRDVLSFKDVRHSAESLSRIFHKPAPVIHEALDFLEQIHWIQKDQYSWSATENSIKIEDDHGNSLIQDFHAESLKQALNHVHSPHDQRKYRALNLALSESEFNEIHGKISAFLTALFNEYSQSPQSIGKKLFQMNYNISPRTAVIEDAK